MARCRIARIGTTSRHYGHSLDPIRISPSLAALPDAPQRDARRFAGPRSVTGYRAPPPPHKQGARRPRRPHPLRCRQVLHLATPLPRRMPLSSRPSARRSVRPRPPPLQGRRCVGVPRRTSPLSRAPVPATSTRECEGELGVGRCGEWAGPAFHGSVHVLSIGMSRILSPTRSPSHTFCSSGLNRSGG